MLPVPTENPTPVLEVEGAVDVFAAALQRVMVEPRTVPIPAEGASPLTLAVAEQLVGLEPVLA
jgi:hypothetical protein